MSKLSSESATVSGKVIAVSTARACGCQDEARSWVLQGQSVQENLHESPRKRQVRTSSFRNSPKYVAIVPIHNSLVKSIYTSLIRMFPYISCFRSCGRPLITRRGFEYTRFLLLLAARFRGPTPSCSK